MKNEQLSGRASRLLRPVMLAGAAAAVWLTLSATTASAETGTGQLSGRPDTAPSSLVPAMLAPAGQSSPLDSGDSSSGLLSPVLGALTRSVDPAAARAPFAPAAAAADAVSELASPVIDLVDGTAAGAVATAATVTSGLLPAAGSVLDPLAGVPAGVAPLPAPPAAVPVLPAPAVPPADRGKAASAQPGGAGVDVGAVTVSPAPDGASAASAQQVPPRADGQPGVQPPAVDAPADDAPGGGVPGGVPAPPGLGAGSSLSASGPAPGPAAEATAFELRPPRGLCETTHPLRQAPQPVSFDPGSSPD